MAKFNIFNRSEFIGVTIIILLITVIQCVRIWVVPIVINNSNVDSILIDVAIKRLNRVQDSIYTFNKKNNTKQFVEIPVNYKFDINFISKDSLAKIGMSKYAINKLINYRKALKSFDSIEQVLNTYGLSKNDSQLILKYAIVNKIDSSVESELLFDKEKYTSISKNDRSTKYSEIDKFNPDKVIVINLNTQFEDSLKMLNGIGKYYANKIIEYGKKLGGYYSIWQLIEIYKIDSNLVMNILPNIEIKGHLKKISINNATIEELKEHPYINYKQAYHLIKYREQHGKYNNINDISSVFSFKEADISRLKPYILFN